MTKKNNGIAEEVMRFILYGALFGCVVAFIIFIYEDERRVEQNTTYYYYLVENDHHVRSVVKATTQRYSKGDRVNIDQYSSIVEQPAPYTYTQKALILKWIKMH